MTSLLDRIARSEGLNSREVHISVWKLKRRRLYGNKGTKGQQSTFLYLFSKLECYLLSIISDCDFWECSSVAHETNYLGTPSWILVTGLTRPAYQRDEISRDFGKNLEIPWVIYSEVTWAIWIWSRRTVSYIKTETQNWLDEPRDLPRVDELI